MGKIYIVRHGKTEWNRLNIAQGIKDLPLNEDGIKSAKELAAKMDLSNIHLCISSPLQRASQTALILCREIVPIIYDDRLKERSFGNLEGTKMDMSMIHKQWDYKLNSSEYNVEPIRDCLKRAQSFIEDIKEKYDDKNLLIVSHGCLIKCLHYCINGYNENTDFEDFFPDNTTLLEYSLVRKK